MPQESVAKLMAALIRHDSQNPEFPTHWAQFLSLALHGQFPIGVLRETIRKMPDPFRKFGKMVICLLEDKPIDVLRIAGSFEIATADRNLAWILVNCACQMLIHNGYLEME
uniref:Uncharacterized protein n=1 Tax=Caenorhabditis japonica TaxID=281687 RepID=A0A8R1ED94_CAEJA